MDNFSTGISFVALILCLNVWMFVHSVKIPTTYLSEACFSEGMTLSTDTHGRVETSEQLWYEHNSDCVTTISVAEGRRVLLLFNRFELENKLDGACVDYLNIHDGPSVDSNTINSAPLCEKRTLGNYTSTNNTITLHFVSDESITQRGFDVVFVAIEDEPCETDGWFTCGTGVCINSLLRCNEYKECWDGSDETGAVCQEMEKEENSNSMGVIIGCSVGGAALFLMVLLIIYKTVDYYRWKKWLAKHGIEDNPLADDVKALQYPITDRYVNHEFHQGRKLGRRNDAFVSEEILEEKLATRKSFEEIMSRPLSAVSNRSVQPESRPSSKLSKTSVTFSEKRNSVSPETNAN